MSRFFVISKSSWIMSSKRRGRPPTGINPVVGVRLPPRLLTKLDEWRLNSPNGVGRPEAIRRLLEHVIGPGHSYKSIKSVLKAGMRVNRKHTKIIESSEEVRL